MYTKHCYFLAINTWEATGSRILSIVFVWNTGIVVAIRGFKGLWTLSSYTIETDSTRIEFFQITTVVMCHSTRLYLLNDETPLTFLHTTHCSHNFRATLADEKFLSPALFSLIKLPNMYMSILWSLYFYGSTANLFYHIPLILDLAMTSSSN